MSGVRHGFTPETDNPGQRTIVSNIRVNCSLPPIFIIEAVDYKVKERKGLGII